MAIKFPTQQELAPSSEISLNNVRHPQYGRYLEEYVPGQLFVHPRGFSFTQSNIDAFSRTYMQCNPLYLDLEYARAHGFSQLPASPQMVFNVVLSLGVQNDSEKVIANLGYYNAQFLTPVYPGDTVRAMTMVTDRKERGADKPGIVTIRTLGVNQRDEVVLQYERKLMVAYRGDRLPTTPLSNAALPAFPWQTDAGVKLPDGLATALRHVPKSVTGWNTYAEDFKAGDIVVHNNGRTISDEHFALTYQVGNTHPLHYDRIYSSAQSGPMSGNPIVYGGLVYAWLEGLASRDLSENALWEIGFTEGYHTQPAFAGDTVFALSRILAVSDAPGELKDLASVVSIQFIGVKGITSAKALEQYGADLF
ncbi:MAG TPA: MaoC family dehydratase, partial [Dongiaceae bacterium]|nr:MaoC family dehydratase [Dongiaceae bacterium]